MVVKVSRILRIILITNGSVQIPCTLHLVANMWKMLSDFVLSLVRMCRERILLASGGRLNAVRYDPRAMRRLCPTSRYFSFSIFLKLSFLFWSRLARSLLMSSTTRYSTVQPLAYTGTDVISPSLLRFHVNSSCYGFQLRVVSILTCFHRNVVDCGEVITCAFGVHVPLRENYFT